MKERLRFPMYDTWLLEDATYTAGKVMDFFTVQKGSVGSGFSSSKTSLQTNITTSGQMPYKVFRLVGIRVNIFSIVATPTVVGDLNQIINNCVLTLKKEDRAIVELPLHWFPSGVGIQGQSSAAGTDFCSNGANSLSNIYKILPELFTTGDRFQLDITTKNQIVVSADTYIEVLLEGVVDKKF